MNKAAIATLCATSFLMGAMVVVPGLAMGRPQEPTSRIVNSLECNGSDVRDALRQVLRGYSYRIAPDVQGTITLSLKNVPLDTALENITRQVDADFTMQNGVYEIYKGQPPLRSYDSAPVSARQSMPGPEAKVVQDNDSLYILRGNNLTKVRKYDLKIEKSINLPMIGN